MKASTKRKSRPHAGMTLVEILVAFLIFVFLVASLVSFATGALDSWKEGEERKDIYDRAQEILDLVEDDLRNVVAESQWTRVNDRPVLPAAFWGDFDRHRRPRLRLVRTGRGGTIAVDPENPANPEVPYSFYSDGWEVAYVMDEDPTRTILYRGIRYFDRRDSDSLFNDEIIGRTAGARFERSFSPVDHGVLYLGFRYWTEFTNTWKEEHALVLERGQKSKPSGPSRVWDSTRIREPEFLYHRRRADPEDADFVYPEMVQVVLTLESTASPDRGVALADALDLSARQLRVSSTRGLPDPPGYIKVGKEWMEIEGMTENEIAIRRRGARGTKPEAHARDERVRFGPTFTMDVRIPVYREPGGR